MSKIVCWVFINYCVGATWSLVCYNCSANHRVPAGPGCAGFFASPEQIFNNSRNLTVSCTGNDAMCFVRSWHARGHYAYIVQRGCYYSSEADPLVAVMDIPTRSMSCMRSRLPEAEYKMCLCKADWCNSSDQNMYVKICLILIVLVIGVVT